MQHLQAARGGDRCGIQQDIGVAVSWRQPAVGRDPGNARTDAPSVARMTLPGGESAQADCRGGAHRIGLWTSGTLDLNDDHGIEFSSTGLTLGVDLPVTRRLTLGAAFGVALGTDRVGRLGSDVESEALAFSTYGSYRLRKSYFIEWMGGYSSLDSDTRRSTATDGQLSSRRSGHVLFASLSLGADLRLGAITLSPYVRNDLASVSLDAFDETAQAAVALSFAETDQTLDTFVAGARLSSPTRLSWGRFAPFVRIEYRHNFASGFVQPIVYAGRPEMQYSLAGGGDNRGIASAAGGLELHAGALGATLEYGTSSRSIDGFGGHAVRLSGRIGF
jgi:uncharacterized protein with beta-barrel porin domain